MKTLGGLSSLTWQIPGRQKKKRNKKSDLNEIDLIGCSLIFKRNQREKEIEFLSSLLTLPSFSYPSSHLKSNNHILKSDSYKILSPLAVSSPNGPWYLDQGKAGLDIEVWGSFSRWKACLGLLLHPKGKAGKRQKSPRVLGTNFNIADGQVSTWQLARRDGHPFFKGFLLPQHALITQQQNDSTEFKCSDEKVFKRYLFSCTL